MLQQEDISRLKEQGYLTNKTAAIYDVEFYRALVEMPWGKWLQEPSALRCRLAYLELFHHWIATSKLNKISGLENFQVRHLINGTTQTFDEAYMKHSHRRLRVFPGEYAYHERVVPRFQTLDSSPLDEGDYVILSAPFCSSGDLHPKTYSLLDEAYAKKVPVIIDCAYFGTCTDFELDVSHPAIESVSFSLTKGLGLGDIRSGIRYSNLKDKNPIAQQNEYDHTVLAAARIGIYMMERFSCDYIPSKYRVAQVQVCEELHLMPTKCMHLALGDEHWTDFQIAANCNRIGIRNLVKARFNKEL